MGSLGNEPSEHYLHPTEMGPGRREAPFSPEGRSRSLLPPPHLSTLSRLDGSGNPGVLEGMTGSNPGGDVTEGAGLEMTPC